MWTLSLFEQSVKRVKSHSVQGQRSEYTQKCVFLSIVQCSVGYQCDLELNILLYVALTYTLFVSDATKKMHQARVILCLFRLENGCQPLPTSLSHHGPL